MHLDRRPGQARLRARVTLSASRPMASTWSRWEWVTKMWSTRVISSSVRSPTPVPASISTSSSTRKEVVRLPAAIEPEQPSTRICMAQRGLDRGRHRSRGWGVATGSPMLIGPERRRKSRMRKPHPRSGCAAVTQAAMS
jgi:hypothetical protein